MPSSSRKSFDHIDGWRGVPSVQQVAGGEKIECVPRCGHEIIEKTIDFRPKGFERRPEISRGRSLVGASAMIILLFSNKDIGRNSS